MQTLSTILIIVASLLFLVSFFRIITDEKGLVNLNQYRFAGCLPDFIKGLYFGCCDLMNKTRSDNSISVVILLVGIVLFIAGLVSARI